MPVVLLFYTFNSLFNQSIEKELASHVRIK